MQLFTPVKVMLRCAVVACEASPPLPPLPPGGRVALALPSQEPPSLGVTKVSQTLLKTGNWSNNNQKYLCCEIQI